MYSQLFYAICCLLATQFATWTAPVATSEPAEPELPAKVDTLQYEPEQTPDLEQVLSRTTGFTDFISGGMQVPQSPQTQGYTPTSIRELASAHPGEGIVPVDPPIANPMGTAHLSFPIKLPPGRKDLTPQLAISYSSDNGNGWLGLGWSLDLPAIEVETRWGVPRYLADKESETYRFNGDQLYPVSHRGSLRPRTGNEKVFFPRVEGSFQKIIRHGKNPKEYWWEVIDKTGTRHFYGGLPGEDVIADAVLTDSEGNIAHWALLESRDLDGNFIRYTCEIVQDPGVAGSTFLGSQIYPKRITYTGHGTTEGKYSVDFLRTRPGAVRRSDVEIDARQGFKKVTADLLYRMEVRFDGDLVRAYELDYSEGAFHKTLLSSIKEVDKNGEVFYQNSFDYYDEVRRNGDYQPFTDFVDWEVPSDNLTGAIVTPINNESTVLGSSQSNNFSAGMAITVGSVFGNPFAKTNTAGGNYTYGNAQSFGMTSLADLSGDGLPDKVFFKNGRLYYRANDGTGGFGPVRAIDGLATSFEQTVTQSHSAGLEGHPFPGYLGFTQTWATSTTDAYFVDLNGDALLDIANGGKGYFNFLNQEQQPEFTTNSGLTPSPISNSNLVDVAPPPPSQEELDSLNDQFPLHDVVRMWEAPYAGIVSIEAPVRLLNNDVPPGLDYTKKDGARVSIQKGGTVLWQDRLLPEGPTETSPPANSVNNIEIAAGERIYFRLQSVDNGAYDQVAWRPVIYYENEDTSRTDVNGKHCFQFDAGADFLTTSCQVVSLPVEGTVAVSGAFSKPVTSDDVRVQIVQVEEEQEITIYDTLFAYDQIVDSFAIALNRPVAAEENWIFRVVANTNVDWSAISWLPRIDYTETAAGIPTAGLGICPAVEFTMYNKVIRKTPVWKAMQSGRYRIIPTLGIDAGPGGEKRFSVTFSAKGIDTLYAKQVGQFQNGQITGLTPADLELTAGDTVYFEYHLADDLRRDSAGDRRLTLQNTGLTISGPAGQPEKLAAGVFTKIPDDGVIFGPLYRGWGHFAYNGNRERADRPIAENELNADEYEVEEGEETDFDMSKVNFIILIAEPKNGRWIGADTLTYLRAGGMSSSRFGEDDVSGVQNVAVGDDCKFVPKKISKSSTQSATGGIGPASVAGTFSTSESVTDFMDLNGDQYPDIVHQDRIIYTNHFGELAETVAYSLGNHLARSNAIGVGAAGNPGNSNTSNSGNAAGAGSNRSSIRAKAKAGRLNYNSREASESASYSGGFSADVNYDVDYAEHSWMDINGDGLPDKVFNDGTAALNLGYSFGPKENWAIEKIRAGESLDIGVGAGVNLFNGSFEAGISSSITFNSSNGALQDVNGDGLVDYIITKGFVRDRFDQMTAAIGRAFSRGQNIGDELVESFVVPKDHIQVRLNTGNGFSAEPLTWPGVRVMDEGSAAAESVNTAVTGCIPIPILGIRICFNPNGSTGRGLSRQKTLLTDINGDGFPDHLESDNDGNLRVKLSTIGKTNLLKQINRPFGGIVTLNYKLTGNTVDLPFGKWVLAEASIHDGLEGDGADVMKYAFDYSNGYYDRHERLFYGFDTIRTHQLDTRKDNQPYRTYVNTYFNRDYYRKTLPRSSYIQDEAGKKYTETLYTYTLSNSRTGEATPPGAERADSSTIFPALTEVRQRYYEGQADPGLETKMVYEYDEVGNIITYTDTGDGWPEDSYTVRMDYHDLPERYLKSAVKSTEIETADGILRKRKADIDATGNSTRVKIFLNEEEAAVYDMQYNQYGLLTRMTRPANYRGDRLFYEYQYDDVVHSYITQVTDAYGYSTSSTYDYEFGQILETVDPNQQKTVYTLDERGRTTSMTGPYELAAGRPYTIEYTYQTEAEHPYALTRHYDPEHGEAIETYTFADGLFRPVSVKKTGSLYQGSGQEDQVRMIVSGQKVYDAFGRVIESYYPTTEPLSAAEQINLNKDVVAPTRMTYDVLDRPLTTTLPDGAVTTIEYGFGQDNTSYTAFRKTMTDPLSNVRETFTDVRGRDRAIAAHGPEGIIWTNFSYNALSELLRVTDHHEYSTIYTYDKLGRQTSRRHPDGGLVLFTYDLAGNLIERTTDNIRQTTPGGAIQYHYEFERLTGIDYPRNFQNKVQLHYGEPDAPFNRAGRVWLVEDASGGSEYFFGPLGETTKTIRTMLTSEGNMRTFVSESTYDTWNRLQEMIYPDGEVVEYIYNRAGKLQRMESEKLGVHYPIVDQLGYDKFEQRVFCAYGNDIHTEYTYEPDRRRLNQLHVQSDRKQAFINNQYRYDPIGNIMELSNQASASAAGPGGSTAYQYQYDPLYRLTNATGNWTGANESADFQLSMAYDNLHNILLKDQTHERAGQVEEQTTYSQEYWYDNDLPHAATEIGGQSLYYDGNGNLTLCRDTVSNTVTRYLWDEEDRLMGAIRNGYMSQYTYDASGERAVKSHGPSRAVFANGVPLGAITIFHYNNYTAYVSPYFVADEYNFTKHYYIENERVLTKTGSGEFNNDYWNFRGVTAGNKNYIERQQLLQQAYQQQIQQMDVPPGEPTVPSDIFPVAGLDSLPDYDNTYPPGWPRPILPDTTGAPGEPTLVDYEFPDSSGAAAGYGFFATGAAKELNQFFYHSDHLGNTNYVTDAYGAVRQHTEYLPFGEIFVDEHQSTDTQPYLFNAKERDEETGLYYYGARYYDPEMSLWLGVDPAAEKFPSYSPYNYTLHNPTTLVDPDGREVVVPTKRHRKNILKWINSQTGGAFGFDTQGRLVKRSEPKAGVVASPTYINMLEQAINHESTIEIYRQRRFGNDNDPFAPTGSISDVESFGGGATSDVLSDPMDNKKKRIRVYVTGTKNYKFQGKIAGTSRTGKVNPQIPGKDFKFSRGDILMHELAGHAIPRLFGGAGQGSALVNENVVRKELGKRIRWEYKGHPQ